MSASKRAGPVPISNLLLARPSTKAVAAAGLSKTASAIENEAYTTACSRVSSEYICRRLQTSRLTVIRKSTTRPATYRAVQPTLLYLGPDHPLKTTMARKDPHPASPSATTKTATTSPAA